MAQTCRIILRVSGIYVPMLWLIYAFRIGTSLPFGVAALQRGKGFRDPTREEDPLAGPSHPRP